MVDWNEFADHYIEKLRGPDSDDARHSLIEADDVIVPILIDAFRDEQDPAIRSQLTVIVWQHRLPETTKFLSEALDDPAPEVWKNALDGLVALGGQSATQVLQAARQRSSGGNREKRVQAKWIDEAIQQVEEKGT